ncbi:MAG: hypothetical protein ACOYU2_04295 [Nitrospirota bacterium]
MEQEYIIAIIAASSALCGVIISQAISILLSRLDQRHKKHILLRQKYEEMMFYFQDSLTYYNQVATCRIRDQLLQLNHSIPAQRAMGLALLYFPNFVSILDTYIRNQISYYNLVVSSYNPKIPANAGAQARVHNKSQLEAAENNLFQSKDKIIDELKANVKKYIKA